MHKKKTDPITKRLKLSLKHMRLQLKYKENEIRGLKARLGLFTAKSPMSLIRSVKSSLETEQSTIPSAKLK